MEIHPFSVGTQCSVAVNAASLARRSPVTSFLGKPQVVAAAVGTAMMGVAGQAMAHAPRPDPGFHPNHTEMLYIEGIFFGISVGAVYVLARTFGDTFRL